MSQSTALQFDDLSESAAIVADMVLIVRARFVEAADTMNNMEVSNLRPAVMRSFWPDYPADSISGVSLGYAINGNKVRHRPSASAISRAEEVMYGWLLDYVKDEDSRVLIGKWSMCLAAPRQAGSFRQFCQKTGRVRRTAERRLLNEFTSISSTLLKSVQSLHHPDWERVSPMMPNTCTDFDKVGTPVARHDLHMMTEGSRPTHDPESPELLALVKRLQKAKRQRETRKREAA